MSTNILNEHAGTSSKQEGLSFVYTKDGGSRHLQDDTWSTKLHGITSKIIIQVSANPWEYAINYMHKSPSRKANTFSVKKFLTV